MFVDLKFDLIIPMLYFIRLFAVRYMHIYLYVVIYVQCVVYDFILKIKFDCKSRDSYVAIIALRIYSHARWVNLFQVPVRLILERHDSCRSPYYPVWYGS